MSVSVGDEGDLQLADSEAGSCVTDSELDLPAYWTCAQCHDTNDNATYRYCIKCFKVESTAHQTIQKLKIKLN
jgi:hypothetical protein